jgi:hypothetical protein
MDESSWEKLVSQLLVASKLGRRISLVRGRSSAQIDCGSDSDPIHDLHRVDQVFGSAINVLMQVDDSVLPTPNVGHLAHGGDIVRRV